MEPSPDGLESPEQKRRAGRSTRVAGVNASGGMGIEESGQGSDFECENIREGGTKKQSPLPEAVRLRRPRPV